MIYFQKFKVFNEMEMEINVINNKIFTELYLKIIVSVNIYQTKKSISVVMETCFFYGKLMKQFGIPPPPLSTNPLLLSNIFMTLLCPNLKNENNTPPPHPSYPPPPPPYYRGEKTIIANLREENSNFLKCLRLRIYTCATKS